MKHPKFDRMYLIAAWIFWYVGDISVTLYAQPASYWSRNFEQVNEANPVARYALETHPAAFISGAVLYLAIFSVAICYTPKMIAWWLSIGLLLAHFGGMKSWMPSLFDMNYYFYWEAGLNSLAAALAAWCYLMASKSSNS